MLLPTVENIKCAFNSNELQKLLGGYWYLGDTGKTEPDLFYIDYFVVGTGQVRGPRACFIAWDEETWLKGTGNHGHYADLAQDTHKALEQQYFRPNVKSSLCCTIALFPIKKLEGILPQLIVPNSYDCINILAEAARTKAANNCKIIAVTGAVGKSTTTAMINCLIKNESDCIANINGHNTRTGVPLWLAESGRFDTQFKKEDDKPNVCVLEVAESALWMRRGGICKILKPHIGIITYVALTQYQQGSRNVKDMVNCMSKVVEETAEEGGYALVYRQTPEYEAVIEKVSGYGAKPISYGFTPDSDSYIIEYDFPIPEVGKDFVPVSKVEAMILGENISYAVSGIGRPIVINSLAALTAAKLAGFDIQTVSKHLSDFKTKDNVLQVSNLCGICLIDDSHNSSVDSFAAAMDLHEKIKQPPESKKIVIRSRIVNMGEKTKELHRDMLKDLITESSADLFFFHDPYEEMSLLIPELPPEIVGGVYKTAQDITAAVLSYIQPDDSLLVKGGPRGTDFGDVLSLLTEGIKKKFSQPSENHQRPEMPIVVQTASSAPNVVKIPASVIAFSADKNKTVWQKGNPEAKYPGGLSLPIFIYYLLDLIRKEELSWHDEVTVNEYAEKEARQPNSLGLAHDEKVNLLTLYKAAVISNSPDAITALSGHIYEKIGKSKKKTVSALRKIGIGWGIPESAVKNVTGRYYEKNPQHFTPELFLKAAMQLLSFDLKNMLSQKNVQYKDKYFESGGVLDNPPVSRHFSFSTGLSINTACMCGCGDETLFIAVCGAATSLERDQLLLEAIHRARMPLPEPHANFIPVDKNALTLCGDTYCGERYTKWRIMRDIDDPIQKYGDEGYAYSFEKVAPLISPHTFNIINSECVLSPVYDETQQTGKYLDFVLGAHPEKTIECYKKFNINAVMLANNHAMDFGAVGCRQTFNYFKDGELNPIGTGGNIDEAEKPLLIKISDKKVIVFNAYCYYAEKRNKIFNHYSLGANTGTAFGTDMIDDISLWRRMRVYREKNPDAFIVFSPHWSTDFNRRHAHLRPIAAKAFDAGADIIIGHGPHIPIGAEYVNNRLCVYSIGNFVFNTTGIDLDASGQSPYGIVAQIDFSMARPELRLYPIYAHNLNTFFQPYPLTDQKQFEEFTASFLGLEKFKAKRDEIGYYLTLEV